MIGMTYEQIVSRIKTEKELSESEIDKKVEKKLKELSGLITKEGAAHIIANELGIKLYEGLKEKQFKIKELNPFLRNIEVKGKVVRLYDIRSFKTEKREGRIATFLLGDETGVIRAVVWDEPIIKQIEKGKHPENSAVIIKNAYVRENNGYRELHLGTGSSIEECSESFSVAERKQQQQAKPISEVKENEFATVRGTIVDVFEPRFYDACPECGKKLAQEGSKFTCREHGKREPVAAIILNFYLDDGTDSIRATCFRDTAEKLLGVKGKALKANPELFFESKRKMLGLEAEVSGKAKNNEFFNRVELTANSVKEAEPKEIIEALEK
ncbi:MAG: hypothetical protein ABIB71_02430 [Candidatus Woesearchaeota archaeon]